MSSALLSTLLALAAAMLALSVLVQIVQEVYKYLSSSKERAYTNALLDFLGPWSSQLLQPGRVMKLQIRGPLQWFRFRPNQRILPMQHDELISALETTAPVWVKRTLERLKLEVGFQNSSTSIPSPTWRNFLTELGAVEKGAPGFWSAYEVSQFLLQYGHRIAPHERKSTDSEGTERLGDIWYSEEKPFNAAEILAAFRLKFLPHILRAGENFEQLQTNFQFQYERRNLRQTFVIALAVALLFNLSLQRLYHYAAAVSPTEASALAERTLNLYQEYRQAAEVTPTNSTAEVAVMDTLKLKKLMNLSQEILEQSKGVTFNFVGKEVFDGFGTFFNYLFGCLITALLLSFGAPIWNDAASALLNIQKAKRQELLTFQKGTANG
jgi:hypothetical protein